MTGRMLALTPTLSRSGRGRDPFSRLREKVREAPDEGEPDEIRPPDRDRHRSRVLAAWYVAAALMNAPLQRDAFANAGRTDYSTRDLIVDSLNMERPKLPGAASDRRRTLQARARDRADLEAQPRLSRRDHARGDADRLSDRRGARHRPRRPHRLDALARAIDDALDRRLADGADHRARADDRRHPQPVRHHRRRAQGGDRRLSVVLPDHGRHGERLPLARSAAARSHAHLFGDAGCRPSSSCARPRARRSSSPA